MKTKNIQISFRLKVKNKSQFELICKFPYDLHKDVPLTASCIGQVNKLDEWLRDFDGIYFTGQVNDQGYDGNIHTLVYVYKTVDSDSFDLSKQLIKYFGRTVTKKQNQRLEIIMSKKIAPYKLWSIDSLKVECKRREFDPKDYEDAKPTEKMVLVALIQADIDAQEVTPTKTKKLSAGKKAAKETVSKKVAEPEEELEAIVEDVPKRNHKPVIDDVDWQEALYDMLKEKTRQELLIYARDNGILPLLKEIETPIMKSDDENAIVEKIINVHPEPEIPEQPLDEPEAIEDIPEDEPEDIPEDEPEKLEEVVDEPEEDLVEEVEEVDELAEEPDELAEEPVVEEPVVEEPEPVDPRNELREILLVCDRAGLKEYIKDELMTEYKASGKTLVASMSEADIIELIVEITPFDEPDAKVPAKKKPAPKKPSNKVNMNDKLKKLKIWPKGGQYLKTEQKEVLLKGKGIDADSKKILAALKRKMKEIDAKRNEGLKKSMEDRKKQTK